MVRITHTQNRASHVRFGDVHGRYVEFPEGERTTHVPAVDALWAADNYDAVFLATDLPREYATLQSVASAAETDEITGNDSKEAILEWLDRLPHGEREALYDEVGYRA